MNNTLFEDELRSTGRAGIEDMIKAVRRSDFYEVAGSGGHDREKGGTLNHSLWVLHVAREELKKNAGKYPGVTDDSLIIVCLLHDLGNTSPKVAYHRYSGHGRRSALIVDRVRRHHGLDVSDVELAAIRFHRGHNIKDDFDKKLDAFSKTPLIKLLKYADWTAAGVFNCTPFGKQRIDRIMGKRSHVECNVVYAPSVKYWYLDYRRMNNDVIHTSKGDVALKSLERKKTVCQCYVAVLYGMAAYDLLFMKDETGGIGVMTTVEYNDDWDGSLYRTDGKGFNYRKAVLYYNAYGVWAHAYYVAVEDRNGEWSVIEIKNGKRKDPNYPEFHQRHLIAQHCKSEADAVHAVREKHHGVNLRNGYFLRMKI